MATKKTKQPKFTLALTIGDKVYKSSGASPNEALTSLERPTKIMLKGILTVSDGERTKEILLQPPKIKRLFFNSGNIQAVIAKQLFALMK